jgi:hypothetical protein
MNILHTIKWKKVNILRRHCLLKRVIEGKIEERINVKVRRGRRRKKLVNHLQETEERIMEIERKSL